MLGWDIIPLLCRSSQHWGEVFLHHNPTSTVRPCACRRSLLCVMLWLCFSELVSFWKNRQIEHSNFKGKYTTLFCKRVLKTWEKEKGIVRVNVTKRMTAPVCPSAFLMLPTKWSQWHSSDDVPAFWTGLGLIRSYHLKIYLTLQVINNRFICSPWTIKSKEA